MDDRQPVRVLFEVKASVEKAPKSRSQSKSGDIDSGIIATKSVKFQLDSLDPISPTKAAGNTSKQSIQPDNTRTAGRFIVPQMCKLSVARQSQQTLAPRNPRKCLSASNRNNTKHNDALQSTWIFPSTKSINRDMTLIDLDIRVLESKQYEYKEQTPISALPKNRNGDSHLPTSNRRPRSSNSNMGSVLRKSFPVRNETLSSMHVNEWTSESRLPESEEHLSRPGLEIGRTSQESFRKNFRRPASFNSGSNGVIVAPLSYSNPL